MNKQAQLAFTISAGVCCGILICFYSLVVFRMFRQPTVFYRVITLIFLLICSQIFFVICNILLLTYYYNDSHSTLILTCIFSSLSFVCFSIAHWIFSMTYWACSVRLELQVQGKEQSKWDKWINVVDVVLICFITVCAICHGWFSTEALYSGKDFIGVSFKVFFSFTVIFLSLSIFLLVDAVIRIKRVMGD